MIDASTAVYEEADNDHEDVLVSPGLTDDTNVNPEFTSTPSKRYVVTVEKNDIVEEHTTNTALDAGDICAEYISMGYSVSGERVR
jgi:hypothetical protein